jgi:hypothetical protein
MQWLNVVCNAEKLENSQKISVPKCKNYIFARHFLHLRGYFVSDKVVKKYKNRPNPTRAIQTSV